MEVDHKCPVVWEIATVASCDLTHAHKARVRGPPPLSILARTTVLGTIALHPPPPAFTVSGTCSILGDKCRFLAVRLIF